MTPSGLMLLPDRHMLLFVPLNIRSGLTEAFTAGTNVWVCFSRHRNAAQFELVVRWSNQRGDRTVMAIPSRLLERVPTHVVTRAQRRWRRAQSERRRATIAMALHPRLGAGSALGELGCDALRAVGSFL